MYSSHQKKDYQEIDHLIFAFTEHPTPTSGDDIKQFDDEAPVMLELWGVQSTPSLPLLSGPIYGSNRSVWYLNCIQTNDLCEIELFEIELFNDLTVCKLVTDV